MTHETSSTFRPDLPPSSDHCFSPQLTQALLRYASHNIHSVCHCLTCYNLRGYYNDNDHDLRNDAQAVLFSHADAFTATIPTSL